MNKNDSSNVYLLVFPDKNAIKIGKANEINSRISTLRRYWGEPDYKKSYSIRTSSKCVGNLEKGLHLFLSNYSIAFEKGDGKTEFFTLDSIEHALTYIDMYNSISSNNTEIEITKGIKKTQTLKKTKKAEIRKKNRYFTRTKELHKNIKNDTSIALEKTEIILDLLKALYYKKIKYQYNIFGGYIFFRFIHNGELTFCPLDLLRLRVSYTKHTTGINFCSSYSRVDTLHQISIKTINNEKDDNAPYLHLYIQNILLGSLRMIPQKSIALTNNIPIIDDQFHTYKNIIKQSNLPWDKVFSNPKMSLKKT